jgi:ketosteroid isomerase-like protein
MQAPVSRSLVEAFYAALSSSDPAKMAPFIHDDAHWVIAGPVDLLQFCGERHGKAAILRRFDRALSGCCTSRRFCRKSC